MTPQSGVDAQRVRWCFVLQHVQRKVVGWLRRYMDFVTVEANWKFDQNQPEAVFSSAGERVLYRRILSVALFLVSSGSLMAARDLAVISNKGNGVTTITLPDLVKICKAEMNRWPDGKPVTFIMRAPSTAELKILIEKVYGLPVDQVKDLVASANHGRMNHPAIVIVDSDEDLVNKVAALPGAVGVVDVYAINSSVAVVKLAGKLPLEPGYLLHGN